MPSTGSAEGAEGAVVQQVVLYLVTAVIFLGADVVWIKAYVRHVFETHVGDMLLDDFRVLPAVGFYALYVVGMLYFASAAGLSGKPLLRVAVDAGIFGFFCYGTYALTNYATLKGWHPQMVASDLLWGTFATAIAAVLGVLITRAIFGTAPAAG
ncbi:MAG: DUF2177 family protein [Pseudomonadota bacterium]